MWKGASSKEAFSAWQLSGEIEITHKSALFVLRRIRHGLGANADAPKMTGTIEVDETYIGGKPRRHQRSKLRTDSLHTQRNG